MESSLHQVADKFSLLKVFTVITGERDRAGEFLSVLGEESEVGVETASEPGGSHHIVLSPAGSQRVPEEARGTGADGHVVPGLTLGVLTTGVLTGRPTVVVEAGPVQGTLAVVDTFSPGAPDQRVSPVAGRTGADGSVSPGPVEPGLALSPGPAGVGSAEIFLLERSAAHEWISGVALGAGTDGLVVGGLAGRSLSAHVGVGVVAGVAALEPHAGLVGGAVPVSGALGVALRVSLALVTTPGQRVANICVLTPADRSVVRANLDKVIMKFPQLNISLIVSHLAVSVLATGSADLSPGEPSAVPEGIPSGSLGTPTDGHVVLNCTVGSLPTGQGTGVDTLVALAGAL